MRKLFQFSRKQTCVDRYCLDCVKLILFSRHLSANNQTNLTTNNDSNFYNHSNTYLLLSSTLHCYITMPTIVSIPALDTHGNARWEAFGHDEAVTEDTVERFYDFAMDHARDLIQQYGLKPGDLAVAEDSYRYTNALMVNRRGTGFVETAFDMDDGFAISWKEIPDEVSDPLDYFKELLSDPYIGLELTPNVCCVDGEFQYYETPDADFVSITRDDALNHFVQHRST